MPRAFARAFKGRGANVSLSSERVHRPSAPLGEYDRNILCASCDRELGKFDQYAIGLSNRFGQAHRLTGKGTFELSPFDGIAYSKFVLAVLWRASVSERPKLKGFSLGKHEEHI